METLTGKLWNSNFTLAFMANFMMMMAFYFLMPTLPFYLIGSLGADKSVVGVVVSVYIISAVVVRPFSGFLIDMLNRKPLYVAVFFFFTAVFGGYILFTSISLILMVRIVQGAIWGIIIPLGNTLALDVIPSSQRGAGIGFFGMSSTLAMALGPLFGLMMYSKFGFDIVVYASIAISTLGVLLAMFIKTSHKAPVRSQPISLDRFILVKAIPVGVNIIFVCFSYGLVVAYAALYGSEMGVKNTGLFFILMAVGVIAARLTTSRYIDRGYYNRISIISLVMITIGYALLGLAQTALVYYSMALVIGVACGMLFPTIQTMVVGFADHHQRGTATSTYFTAFDIGVGLGMLLGGSIAQWASLSTAFVIGAGVNLAATLYYIKVSAPCYNRIKRDKAI